MHNGADGQVDIEYLLREVERLDGESLYHVTLADNLQSQLAAEREKYQRLVGVARIVAMLERNTALQAALAALQEEK